MALAAPQRQATRLWQAQRWLKRATECAQFSGLRGLHVHEERAMLATLSRAFGLEGLDSASPDPSVSAQEPDWQQEEGRQR